MIRVVLRNRRMVVVVVALLMLLAAMEPMDALANCKWTRWCAD